MTLGNYESLNLNEAERRFSKYERFSGSNSDEYRSYGDGPNFTVELRKPRARYSSVRDLVVRIISPDQKGISQGYAYLGFALIVDSESNVTGLHDENDGAATSLFYYPPDDDHMYYVLDYSVNPADPVQMTLGTIKKMRFETQRTSRVAEWQPGDDEFSNFLTRAQLPENVNWLETVRMYAFGTRPDGESLTAESILSDPLVV